MKKTTFVLCLLMTSLSFSQTLIEDFEGPIFPTLSVANGASLASPSPIIPDPAGIKDDVLALISNGAGQPWQQTELLLQNGNLDLSGTDKRVSVDWYSVPAFSAFIRVDNQISGTVAAATAEVAHPGGGWATLVFDFSTQAQPSQTGSVPPDGVYRDMYFFNHWNIVTGDFHNPFTATTTYIDNIIKGVSQSTTWTGNGDTNTNWNAAANWTNGVPTTSIDVIIPDLTNDPIAAGNIAVKNMSIQSNASVTIIGAVTNSGTISVSSGASFIAKTSVSGAITYQRSLSSTNWYSISSPVVGQDVDNFVAASGLQSGETDISFCNFDTATNNWVFYQNGTSNADVLNEGQGYIVNLTGASGDISFNGTMNVGNETIALATTSEGYNLLGNPYPSFIDSNALLTTSSGSLLSETIWVWDQSTNTYITKVSSDNFLIAPGQGFFIQSNGAAGNVVINEAFQSHNSTDTFLRTTARTEVYLTLSDGSNAKDCKLYFLEGATTSFDNGYDGPMFRAFPEDFSIYTHLVSNGFGRDFGVQSLPNDNYNLVIPVGINSLAGTEITISSSSIDLPIGIELYLEDRENETFTLLNANSDFTFTPTNDLNGIGRFYLHISNDALGINENELGNSLQIYTSASTKKLNIKGQINSYTTCDIFDLNSKLVLSKTLEQHNDSNAIDISKISSGLYLVKVSASNQTITQKIIIK